MQVRCCIGGVTVGFEQLPIEFVTVARVIDTRACCFVTHICQLRLHRFLHASTTGKRLGLSQLCFLMLLRITWVRSTNSIKTDGLWSRVRESNSRPHDYKSSALPTELTRQRHGQVRCADVRLRDECADGYHSYQRTNFAFTTIR